MGVAQFRCIFRIFREHRQHFQKVLMQGPVSTDLAIGPSDHMQWRRYSFSSFINSLSAVTGNTGEPSPSFSCSLGLVGIDELLCLLRFVSTKADTK